MSMRLVCIVILLSSAVTFTVSASFSQDNNTFSIYSDQVYNPDLEFEENIALYIWENTGELAELEIHSYSGMFMRFRYNNQKRWFGFGYATLPDDNFRNMSMFKDGYLSVTLKAQGNLPDSIRIGLKSGHTKGGESWVELSNYGFLNNGDWQTITIPISDFIKAQIGFFDLTAISQYFMISGKRNIPRDMILDFDEIYWMKK